MTNGDDPELEALRQQRMAELQQQQASQEMQEQQMAEYQAQKSAAMRQVLTPDARERLNTLRTTKPEFVDGIEQQLIQLANSGKVRLPINDQQLRKLLQQLTPKKKDIKIERR